MAKEAPFEKTVQVLRNHGFQVTSQRVLIYDYLKHSLEHPSAEKIFQDIFRSLPGISRATVYNTLEAFSSRGLIQKINSPAGVACYDGNLEAHAHLVCTHCHRIVDFYKNLLGAFKVPETIWPGFKSLRTSVIFYGICETCRLEMEEESELQKVKYPVVELQEVQTA